MEDDEVNHNDNSNSTNIANNYEEQEQEGEEEEEEVPEAAPTSTTPPLSPRRRALPVCTAVTGALGGHLPRPTTASRDIPRLAGLADYAMRLFLTE